MHFAFRLHRPSVSPERFELTEGQRTGAREAAIELVGVRKGFGDQQVLRGVDLAVHEGQACVVFGVSGSGKSVLLKLVAGLLRPDAGAVRVLGRDLGRLSGRALLTERQSVGVLFQAGALFDSMSVFDNVAFPMRERREFGADEIRRRVEEVLEQVELSRAIDLFPADLSGGMIKRVALARALVFDPPVLVFDEPTAGLDPLNTRTVIELIGRAERSGQRRRSVLAVVNDVAAAFAVADRLALLHDGKIVAHDTPEAFRANPQPAVKAFLDAWSRRNAAARG